MLEIQGNKFTTLSFDRLLQRRLKMDSSDEDIILITLSKKKKALGTQNRDRGVSPPHREAEIADILGCLWDSWRDNLRLV